MAVFAGLAIGRPIGVLVLSWVAVSPGVAIRPPALTWPVLAGGSLLTGIGFTLALLIASLAFTPALLGAAKAGILGASVDCAVAGLAALTWATALRRSASPLRE